MKAQIKLGRIFGVEIGLHYSWFIIALLITFSLAGHFRVHNPEWGESLSWALAVITALLFFTSIVVHELVPGSISHLHGPRGRASVIISAAEAALSTNPYALQQNPWKCLENRAVAEGVYRRDGPRSLSGRR